MNMNYYLHNPSNIILGSIIWADGKFHFLTDKKYLELEFKKNLGHRLNLSNPETYNEKLQWIKLYDRNPLYTKLVDKYAVKDYVSEKIGSKYIIPTYGVWDRFEDIDFNSLPKQFVLKCTHDSGGIYICKDKDLLDYSSAQRIINQSLKRNYYMSGREWPYKNVKPRVLAEAFMEDELTKELRDYKFFAFDGEVKALFIATDRQTPNEDVKFDFYDKEFHHLDLRHGHKNSDKMISKPECFDEMISISEILSKGLPEVRVDLYEVNGNIYFGELTFFHHGGFMPFDPPEWDHTFGEWIKLPAVRKD